MFTPHWVRLLAIALLIAAGVPQLFAPISAASAEEIHYGDMAQQTAGATGGTCCHPDMLPGPSCGPSPCLAAALSVPDASPPHALARQHLPLPVTGYSSVTLAPALPPPRLS